jgi:hypothetical protein
MIVAIEIENFKGIGETQRIEFAPLTLIFGANSSGKSSIVHALHFFREVLETGNGDVDEIRATNGELRLGGFENLVHLHEGKDRKIRIRVDFRIEGENVLSRRIPDLKRLAKIDFNDSLLKKMKNIGIELVVGTHFDHNYEIHHPLVERLTLFVDGAALVGSQATGSTVYRNDEGRVANLFGINLDHYAFVKIGNQTIARLIAEQTEYDPKRFEFDQEEECCGYGEVSDAMGAIPTSESMMNHYSLNDENTSGFDDIEDYYRWELENRFKQFFIGCLLDATKYSLRLLSNLGHLGPIREIPERSRRLTSKSNRHAWYRGQAAWQRLLEVNPNVGSMEYKGDLRWGSFEMDLRRILAAPYIVERLGIWTTCENWWVGGDPKGATRRNLEVVLRDTRTDALVTLEDVGVGISQVIPVIIAAQDKSIPVLFIEQPELHLHPKQQAMLGDLFASQTDKRQRWFEPRAGDQSEERTIVIETHSELLLLRFLRRIRETKESDGSSSSKTPSLKADDLRIYAVDNTDAGTQFRILPISNSGTFVGAWPEGFFDERFDEV